MSELALRRERMARSVRNEERERFKLAIRQRLMQRQMEAARLRPLSIEEWRQMCHEVERTNRHVDTIERVFMVLEQCRPECLAEARILKDIQWFFEDREDLNQVNRLKGRLSTVLCRIIGQGPDALENCFMELLSIMRHHYLEQHEAWQQVALVRHQVITRACLEGYLYFISTWPSELTPIISNVLTTLGNFLHDLNNKRFPPSDSTLYKIIDFVSKILDSYFVIGLDLMCLLTVTDSILCYFGINESLQIILDSSIYSELINMLCERKDRELDRNDILIILKFIGKTLYAKLNLQLEIIRRYAMLFPLLFDILNSSLKVQVKNHRIIEVESVDEEVMSQAMFCLCNLASQRHSVSTIMDCKVFDVCKWLAQMSPTVKEELACLMYNCAINFDFSELELILQKGTLQAIHTLLITSYQPDVVQQCLKSLKIMLQKLKDMPHDNPVWLFHFQNTKKQCSFLGITQAVNEIAEKAGNNSLGKIAAACMAQLSYSGEGDL